MWRVSLSEQYNNNNDRLLIPVILYIAGLLQKIIPQQTQDLEDEFMDVSIQTYDKIIEKDIDVNRFKARLMTLPIKYKEEHEDFFKQIENELEKESTINSIWIKLSKYWNFMNYTLLENLIRNIGDRSLKQNMKSYLSSLETFRRNTRLCDFAEHCPAVESRPSEADLKEFVLHLKLDWETCTLEQLEELKGHIIRKFLLPSFALILKKVSHGSLIVTWLLPAQITSTLVQDLENTDNKGFFKEHKIECMTIDGKEYKYSSIPKYAAFLKDTYSTMEGKNLAAFKLAGIAKEIDRSEMDSFTKSTIRGDKDDVIYKKYPMTEDKVAEWKPRLVLIEGAPGVGKTTFSEQFCFKWSQGQRLNNQNLLVLLPLRDNRVRSAKSISDLFHHPQLQGAIAQEVESSQGEGVVLWLEAWDELEQRMREESSIFLDLVHGRKLPKATIIITSRPWATKPIVKSTSIRVDQHIELVTTPTLELGRVLREERVHPNIRSKFLDYVNYYPAMKAVMHTPVTANIVTDVFKWSRDMESNPPTTVTQLYTAYTCKLLMQHFSGHKAYGKQSWKIGSLEDLPPDVHQQLLALSKLAWEGIMIQQLTFSSADIHGATLGLMVSVKELYLEDAELSYHFIHLIFQEFLAAYHITQLPLHTQQQLIRECVKVGHLSVVMKFYFGLSKFNAFTSEMIREHISGAAAYHWMYESGDTDAISNLMASRELIQVRSSREWSPLDYYVVGHFMAYSQSKWKLGFRYSYMGNEGIEMFSKGLMKMRAVTWKGEITSADFNNCDIHSIEHFVNIPHPILQQFMELDFQYNKLDVISSTLLSELLTCQCLKTLILNSCGITSEGAVQLSAGLAVNKSLTRLELWGNPIGDIGAASIADAIKTNAVLEHLKISRCEITSEGAVQLSAGLAINKSLTRLELFVNPIGDIGIVSIGDAIKTNAVLEHLDIAWCEITSEGAVQLSAGLAINKSLTRLELWCNPIGDIGAASIGDVIKTNAVLEHLDIGYCEITSQGCIHIAAALSENSTLLVLMMEGNAIGVEGAKAMSEMLEKNISLKKLHLHDDHSYEEGVDVILSSLQQNTSLTVLSLSERYKRPADPRVKW